MGMTWGRRSGLTRRGKVASQSLRPHMAGAALALALEEVWDVQVLVGVEHDRRRRGLEHLVVVVFEQ